MIQIVQTALGQTTAPTTALSVPLPHPTTVGNLLVLQLRFSPRTGSPKLSDSYGNRYDRLATTEISASECLVFFTAELVRAGAGHTIIVASQGGLQNLAVTVMEQSVVGRVCGGKPQTNDFLAALLVESVQQTALLQRLVTAQRA